MSNLEEFRKLGVSEVGLEALEAKGFETPTEIQRLAIPKLLDGTLDLIGQARTGTGKTAAFGIPIVEQCSLGAEKPQALILAPTRELSIQISDELISLCGKRRLRIAPFYGGQVIEVQLGRLRRGVDVVVGTPGRIIDLMERGMLDFSALRFAVLDEADEMLDMGFIEDIEKILGSTNTNKRMLMFSATMPPEVLDIAERFMRSYEVLRVEELPQDATQIDQIYYEVRREDKFEALSRIIASEPNLYALVFCRTRGDVDELSEQLRQVGHKVEALHGDISQAQRLRTIGQFKDKKLKIMIATDVAARGIDVSDLTHVINYSIPQNAELYIHRIGRTGRAGKGGTAITFVTPGEMRRLTLIRNETKFEIRRGELPSADAIIELKRSRFSELIAKTIDSGRYQDYREFAEKLMEHFAQPVEVIASLLYLRFGRELLPQSYPEIGARRKREKGERATNPDAVRLFIGCGQEDGYGAVRMLNLFWEKARIKKGRIGRIDCFDRFSFVEVNASDVEAILVAFRRSNIPAELAKDRPEQQPLPANRARRGSRAGHSNRDAEVVPSHSLDQVAPAGDRGKKAPEEEYRSALEVHSERDSRKQKRSVSGSKSGHRADQASVASDATPQPENASRKGARKPTGATTKKPFLSEKKQRLRDWVEKISQEFEEPPKKRRSTKTHK